MSSFISQSDLETGNESFIDATSSSLSKIPFDMVITDMNDQIIFGVGNFIPQEDYNLKEPKLKMDWVPGNTSIMISRVYAFFLFFPKENAVYAIIPGGESNFERFYTNDDTLKERIRNILLKKTKFGISNGEDNQDPFIVVNDNPQSPYRSVDKHAWHTDSINVVAIPQITSGYFDNPYTHIKIPANLKLCDYTIIETTEVCVSTSVLNRYNKTNSNDLFRFWACPGTAICVNNKMEQHSTPCIVGSQCDVDRTIGNELLKEEITDKSKKRNLFRTQIILKNKENAEVFDNFENGIKKGIVECHRFDMSELMPEDTSSFIKIEIKKY